jgi:hypothetical protein
VAGGAGRGQLRVIGAHLQLAPAAHPVSDSLRAQTRWYLSTERTEAHLHRTVRLLVVWRCAAPLNG